MLQNLDVDELWTCACKRADAALDEHGDTIIPGLPRTFTLDELAAERLDIAFGVARVQAASAPPA